MAAEATGAQIGRGLAGPTGWRWRIARLAEQNAALREEQRRLQAERERLEAERERLGVENQRLRAERERLQEVNQRLRGEVEALRRASRSPPVGSSRRCEGPPAGRSHLPGVGRGRAGQPRGRP
jgi:hypothetical protein